MEFLLASTELRTPYEPRLCRLVARLRSEIRDDLALVDVIPPLPREVYGSEDEISQLVLATRHQGASMFPVSEWPLAVYICRLKSGDMPHGDFVPSGELSILDWGEIAEVTGASQTPGAL